MVKKITNIDHFIQSNYTNVKELMSTILGNISVANNKILNEKHILKLCNKNMSSSRLEDAEMEIEIMENCCRFNSSKYLVKLIKVIEDDFKYLIILEYVNGGDLLDLIQNNYPKGLPINKIKKWGKQLLTGLQTLHNNGYCHLDISCENILYDKDNDSIKLCDFGLARKIIPNQAFPVERGGKRGKIGYMAPEIKDYQPYHGQVADIFSLAVVFWIMFTGLPPFEEANKNILKYFGNPKGLFLIIQSWKNAPQSRHVTRIPTDVLTWMAKMFTTKQNYRISINQLLQQTFFKDIIIEDQFKKIINKNINNNNNNNNNDSKIDDSKETSDDEKTRIILDNNNDNNNNLVKNKKNNKFLTQNKSRNEVKLENFNSIKLKNNKKRRNSITLEYSITNGVNDHETIIANVGHSVSDNTKSDGGGGGGINGGNTRRVYNNENIIINVTKSIKKKEKKRANSFSLGITQKTNMNKISKFIKHKKRK